MQTHVSQRHASRYDGDLVQGDGVLGEVGHQCVACLMVRRQLVGLSILDLGLLCWTCCSKPRSPCHHITEKLICVGERERGKQTEDFLLGSTSSTHQFPSIKYNCILCINLLSALADRSHLHAQHHHLLPTVLHTLTHMHTV